jgi:hypothetical protein
MQEIRLEYFDTGQLLSLLEWRQILVPQRNI